MKVHLAVAVMFLVLVNVFSEDLGTNEDLGYWTDLSQAQQEDLMASAPLQEMLRRIARKPRPDQFYGLMGKRAPGGGQITRKRHKSDSFVGLMGKRAMFDDSSEWNTAQNYYRRR
ncbi:protachykinin-1 isoform X1 [Protopterus annectens]|uniref:protachykinin-1 isoform X1 n=1 Tax=Protopterus annectens TaxID=7888 RepID=UPI001CF93F99|nr:protachykinin-1 isoform X1 [Protopterus annectens]